MAAMNNSNRRNAEVQTSSTVTLVVDSLWRKQGSYQGIALAMP